MPTPRPKPSEVAVEAKRKYFPFIAQKCPDWRPYSIIYTGAECVKRSVREAPKNRKLLHDVIDADPIDVALSWHEAEVRQRSSSREHFEMPPGIPVINMTSERRPGGDWESGLNAPEENMCRRSNLVQCLSYNQSPANRTDFCMPAKGGLYSPVVVVFRSGPDQSYAPWSTYMTLPVISVAPIRRPKLDASGQDYSFSQEKEQMKDKIRTVLRIAMEWGHRDLCVSSFGAGPSFRNPPKQLAVMWKEVLYSDPEFEGFFSKVVFAIEKTTYGEALESTFEVFQHEFHPDTVCKTTYR